MFHYQNLTKANYSAVSEFIAANFVADEPTTNHLKINLKDFTLFTDCICKHAIADNLSVIAFDEEQKILGAVICYDYARKAVLPLKLNTDLEIALKMLEILDDVAILALKKEQKVAYIPLMAISQICRSTKLFHDILAFFSTKARANGYRVVYSQETSEYRFRINNFPGKITELGNIVYEDFVLKDKKPFANLLGRCAAIKINLRD